MSTPVELLIVVVIALVGLTFLVISDYLWKQDYEANR